MNILYEIRELFCPSIDSYPYEKEVYFKFILCSILK